MKVKTKILFFFSRIFQSVFLEASIRNFCLKYKFRIYIILECEIILKIQLTSEILPCHRIRCAFVRALGVDGRTRCTLHTAQFDWQTMFDLEFRFVYSLLIFMNIRVEIFEIFLYIYKLYIRFENCENSRSFGKYQIANLWISCIYKFVDTYAEFHNFLHILQILYIYIYIYVDQIGKFWSMVVHRTYITSFCCRSFMKFSISPNVVTDFGLKLLQMERIGRLLARYKINMITTTWFIDFVH